jgi:hypothetical protein
MENNAKRSDMTLLIIGSATCKLLLYSCGTKTNNQMLWLGLVAACKVDYIASLAVVLQVKKQGTSMV